VVCLTATATPRVARDICKAFGIDLTGGLFRTSTYRPNLELLAESGKTKKELYPSLFKFLKNNKGATIVYVTLQKQTEELAAELRQEGFKASSFHAGMDTSTKSKLQDEFMKADDLVIVATIAFGMGKHVLQSFLSTHCHPSFHPPCLSWECDLASW
jgi:superfamily II DNA helicase RecQ